MKSRMTTKGQVVIPKQIRDQVGLHVGDSLRLVREGENLHITRRSGWARATAGCLPSSLPPLEPEELDELIERAALDEARDEWGARD
jgi:AbrB family looped-hinge helix DNA binding protein